MGFGIGGWGEVGVGGRQGRSSFQIPSILQGSAPSPALGKSSHFPPPNTDLTFLFIVKHPRDAGAQGLSRGWSECLGAQVALGSQPLDPSEPQFPHFKKEQPSSSLLQSWEE